MSIIADRGEISFVLDSIGDRGHITHILNSMADKVLTLIFFIRTHL